MARKTKEEAQKTYENLLRSAAQMFTTKGIGPTTLNDIAKHAGVTRGALYWHFDGKAAVIRALWEQYAAPKLETLNDQLVNLSPEDPVEEFRTTISTLFSLVVEDAPLGEVFRMVMQNKEATHRDPDLQAYFYQERETVKSVMTAAFETMAASGALKKGILPEKAALGFLSLVTGILDQYFLPQSEVDLSKDGRLFMGFYLNGILSEPV